MPSTMTPNMSLTLPSVGTEPGPAYALDVNSSLSTVDQHDHTSGNGVPVPSAGLNINTDLPFGNNNLTLVRSMRFNPQGSPLSLGTDLGCLYESGVDLYYNDGNGNQVRITASGSVAGATGSITGLVSPASASYSAGAQTFTWQSNSNVAANMDFRSAILRNNSVSSNGITLAAPSSLPSNYSLTLPSSLPASQSFMTLDSSGNIAANWVVDNSTIEVSSNTVQVKAQGIGTTQLANLSVTNSKIADGTINQAKLEATNYVLSSSSGTYTQTASGPTTVTNLSNIFNTTGRPVYVTLTPDGTTNSPSVFRDVTGGSYLEFYRDTTLLGRINLLQINGFSFAGGFNAVDPTPPVGNVAYTCKATAGGTIAVSNVKLLSYEIL